jgi:hypothetical protein
MSNRSLVELNHDFCPLNTDAELLKWASGMHCFFTSGDPTYLPQGVTFKHMRHHSDPDPLEKRASSGTPGREPQHAAPSVTGEPYPDATTMRSRLTKLSFILTGNDYALLWENPKIEEAIKCYNERVLETAEERKIASVTGEQVPADWIKKAADAIHDQIHDFKGNEAATIAAIIARHVPAITEERIRELARSHGNFTRDDVHTGKWQRVYHGQLVEAITAALKEAGVRR